jgi:GTP cyclohydrolase IA
MSILNDDRGQALTRHPSRVARDMRNTTVDLAQHLLERTTGGDFTSGHMEDTPKRFANMLEELTQRQGFNFTVFDNEQGVDEMVIISDIPFYTLCAHHVIPFYGVAHIAYLPGSKLAGLSKFARTVKYFAKGLNVQEDLTQNIHNFLTDKLVDPIGVGVIMKGEHLCMTMRGVQTPGTFTTTSAMSGAFLDPSKQARAEFLALR